jgi:hypothetical protein
MALLNSVSDRVLFVLTLKMLIQITAALRSSPDRSMCPRELVILSFFYAIGLGAYRSINVSVLMIGPVFQVLRLLFSNQFLKGRSGDHLMLQPFYIFKAKNLSRICYRFFVKL